ncbi:hypothetical protein N658DRAFT_501294 [Parathielavia hyrcaniae]|uniref:Uncharacterized protein n=1 Tax=Parathielavia hyrcaniae TaxID=113614 RepID=A0AAN6SWR8_9PEZI|nr:hypothetical protein N658DRAFT_501294 [Parathielavia hyrcaniae]
MAWVLLLWGFVLAVLRYLASGWLPDLVAMCAMWLWFCIISTLTGLELRADRGYPDMIALIDRCWFIWAGALVSIHSISRYDGSTHHWENKASNPHLPVLKRGSKFPSIVVWASTRSGQNHREGL